MGILLRKIIVLKELYYWKFIIFKILGSSSFATRAQRRKEAQRSVPLPVNTGFAVEELLRFVEGDQE